MADATSGDTEKKMGTVNSADGTEIVFERSGSGPPLVLVHGGGANDHTRWELAGVRPTLAEHCTVYAMDSRGRGKSGDATEYELEREFEDVAAVVDAIDEPVTLLGHSSGALYSLEAALRTDNLRRLILYEPPVLYGKMDPTASDAIAEMKALVDDGENEQALLLFLQDVARIPPEEIDALRSAPNWQKRVDSAHTVPRELQGIAEYEFDASRFKGMATPTLLLMGGESTPIHKDSTEAVNDALPNSRIAIFDGQEHMAMLTATDRFIEEVLAFVSQAD